MVFKYLSISYISFLLNVLQNSCCGPKSRSEAPGPSLGANLHVVEAGRLRVGSTNEHLRYVASCFLDRYVLVSGYSP